MSIGPIAPIDMGEDIETVLDRISRLRLFAGYAGWGEGQLDGELDEEAWFTEPALPGDVFSDESSTLWNRVLRRKGKEFRLVASMPEDPSLN
jgi:putative transcriptional regulator